MLYGGMQEASRCFGHIALIFNPVWIQLQFQYFCRLVSFLAIVIINDELDFDSETAPLQLFGQDN